MSQESQRAPAAEVCGPADARVVVDEARRILEVEVGTLLAPGEPWVGRDFSSLFRPNEWANLENMCARGWVGVSERPWTLAGGCKVLLSLREREGSLTEIGLRDVTAQEAIRSEVERADQAAALAGLAASVAAELATSINVVEGRLELALEMFPDIPEGLAKQLKIALAHTREVSGNTRALRLVGHQALTTTASSSLSEVLESAWAAAAPRMKGAERSGFISASVVVGSESLPLSRALTHLLVVLADEPRRTIQVRARSDMDGVTVELMRGSAPRGGAGVSSVEPRGFAFSVARGLIEGLGGGVQGTFHGDAVTITIRLPLPSKTRARARKGDELVVVVGRAQLSDVLRPILEPEGFALQSVETGDAAIAVVGEAEVAGVITELVLPGCSGLALARHLANGSGPPVVVVCSEGVPCLPHGVTVLSPPIARGPLLRALGRRIRR